jgi:hypothetical protein
MSRKTKKLYLSAEDYKNLLFVLDYLIEAEEKSYEEYVYQELEEEVTKTTSDDYNFILEKKFYERTDIEHIYAIARRVKDTIKL